MRKSSKPCRQPYDNYRGNKFKKQYSYNKLKHANKTESAFRVRPTGEGEVEEFVSRYASSLQVSCLGDISYLNQDHLAYTIVTFVQPKLVMNSTRIVVVIIMFEYHIKD